VVVGKAKDVDLGKVEAVDVGKGMEQAADTSRWVHRDKCYGDCNNCNRDKVTMDNN
jgi:hypothetical protein